MVSKWVKPNPLTNHVLTSCDIQVNQYDGKSSQVKPSQWIEIQETPSIADLSSSFVTYVGDNPPMVERWHGHGDF